jgi:hypothetical protein
LKKHLDKKFEELSIQITKERNDELEKIRREMKEFHSDGDSTIMSEFYNRIKS